MNDALINTLADILVAAVPIMIAAQGELITERAGVVNLSLDGTILLAAMAAFAVAIETDNTLLGLLAAMGIGMLVALLIIAANVFLNVNQVALGFVLTLLCADLSVYLGKPYVGLAGGAVELPYTPIPLLEDIPILGTILFQHSPMVYFSFLLLALIWFWLYRTAPGLSLRALGERPAAAYVRGTRVQLWRFVYVAVGGALVGLAGAAYSLDFKLGWAENSTRGEGWIALALVIFGAWKPLQIAAGALLIVGLRSVALDLQGNESVDIPFSILNMVPWLLMLLTLMFVASGAAEALVRFLPPRWRPTARRWLRSDPPAALGRSFEKE